METKRKQQETVVTTMEDKMGVAITKKGVSQIKNKLAKEFWTQWIGTKVSGDRIRWRCDKCEWMSDAGKRSNHCKVCGGAPLKDLCPKCWTWVRKAQHSECGGKSSTPEAYDSPEGLRKLTEGATPTEMMVVKTETVKRRQGGPKKKAKVERPAPEEEDKTKGKEKLTKKKEEEAPEDVSLSEDELATIEKKMGQLAEGEEKERTRDLLIDIAKNNKIKSLAEKKRKEEEARRAETEGTKEAEANDEEFEELSRRLMLRSKGKVKGDERPPYTHIEVLIGGKEPEVRKQREKRLYLPAWTRKFEVREVEDWQDYAKYVVRKTEKMRKIPAILTIRLKPSGDDQEKQEWATVEVADQGLLNTTREVDSASIVEWVRETNQAAEWTTILLQYGNHEKLAKDLSEAIPTATIMYSTEEVEPLEWILIEVAARRATQATQQEGKSVAVELMKALSPVEIVEKGLRVLVGGDEGLAAAYHALSKGAPEWYKARKYPRIRAPVPWEKLVTETRGDDEDVLLE